MLQSMESQRVRHNLATEQQTTTILKENYLVPTLDFLNPDLVEWHACLH